MQFNKKNILIICLTLGIMLFFFGLAVNIAMGPSTDEYTLPEQVSKVFKLSGMALVCISLIVLGIFVETIEKDQKILLLLFGLIFFLINILTLSVS